MLHFLWLHLPCPNLHCLHLSVPACPQKSDFEDRLRRLAAFAARMPKEGRTDLRRVEAAARRVLQGDEANWKSDIQAKVGAWKE